MTTALTTRRPHIPDLACRLLGHKPGLAAYPASHDWCQRCGAMCDRLGRAVAR